MTRLRMIPGEADEYISEKLRLRDLLFAANYPVTRISFNDFLVQGLPEEWDTFRTTMRTLVRSLTEDEMIANIRNEDDVQQRMNEPERVYTTREPPRGRGGTRGTNSDRQTLHCTNCDKDGHTTARCWNKHPYYCPKCKAQ